MEVQVAPEGSLEASGNSGLSGGCAGVVLVKCSLYSVQQNFRSREGTECVKESVTGGITGQA
jgi:hypothetical protein